MKVNQRELSAVRQQEEEEQNEAQQADNSKRQDEPCYWTFSFLPGTGTRPLPCQQLQAGNDCINSTQS